jgi:hypothetical protein
MCSNQLPFIVPAGRKDPKKCIRNTKWALSNPFAKYSGSQLDDGARVETVDIVCIGNHFPTHTYWLHTFEFHPIGSRKRSIELRDGKATPSKASGDDTRDDVFDFASRVGHVQWNLAVLIQIRTLQRGECSRFESITWSSRDNSANFIKKPKN